MGGLHGRRFSGGDQPNLADISVFGVIRAVTGTGEFELDGATARVGQHLTRCTGSSRAGSNPAAEDVPLFGVIRAATGAGEF